MLSDENTVFAERINALLAESLGLSERRGDVQDIEVGDTGTRQDGTNPSIDAFSYLSRSFEKDRLILRTIHSRNHVRLIGVGKVLSFYFEDGLSNFRERAIENACGVSAKVHG